jgi:hypothetical protein
VFIPGIFGALFCGLGSHTVVPTVLNKNGRRPFVHTPAYCYDPDDPDFGFDEFDDQTCLGGGDWGDFIDDSGGRGGG